MCHQKFVHKNVAYVNFDHNPRMQSVFDGDFDVDRILLAISAETGVSIQEENTLLIFDEIQEVPSALTSLKYFNENAPQYAIVAAGSLWGGCASSRNFLSSWKSEFHGFISFEFSRIFVRTWRRKIK